MARSAERSYLLGLIGAGLSLSRSPAMHEAEGLAQGHPTVYRRLDTDTPRFAGTSLSDVLGAAIDLGFDGLNITHPYKLSVIDLLDDVDEAAGRLGSVNTVVIENGLTRGYNTDVSGYSRALATELADAPRQSVVQVGAGGVGSAVAFALADAGVESLAIRDVDEQRAHDLATHVNSVFGEEIASGGGVGQGSPVEDLISRSDGVVNATPLGMPSHPGTSFDTSCLSAGQWVSDVVYMPVDTELLSRARSTGCRTLDGTHLAVNQAVDAFTIFTGLTADAARMREVFEAQG